MPLGVVLFEFKKKVLLDDTFSLTRKFHAISMEEKKNKKQDTNNSASSTSLSTMLLQGLEAPAKLVKLYQVNAWPQDSDVSKLSPDVLINLLGDVRQWHDSVRENHMNSDGSSNHPNRIAVVSCDGMSRAGVYCATFTSIEQVILLITLPINYLGTIHLRRRQIFMIFDPYPPHVGNHRHSSKMLMKGIFDPYVL